MASCSKPLRRGWGSSPIDLRAAFRVFLEEGTPQAVIVEAAEQWGADLVVVGSFGSTGLARVLIGSVAQKVRHAHCTALVARPSEKTGRVVVGTDFSDPALPALAAAAEESRRAGAAVTTVHSIEAPLLLPSLWRDRLRRDRPYSWPGALEPSRKRPINGSLRHRSK